MTNLPQHHCTQCRITHMVCQDISPKADQQSCQKCGLEYHAFDLKSGPVFCITTREYERVKE